MGNFGEVILGIVQSCVMQGICELSSVVRVDQIFLSRIRFE